MSAHWFLAAIAAVYIFNVHCATPPAGWEMDTRQMILDLISYKPCADENCEYGPSELEPKPTPESQMENPKVHCIMLRPTAVEMFGKIESAYPGISDIKYQLLEELIGHMHVYTSFKLEKCQSAMQLIELVILAANSLKAQYVLQGGEDCIYKSSVNETESLQSANVTETPCQPESSGYITGSKICPGGTMKPDVPSITEKPYVPTSETEETYVPSSTKPPIAEKPYMPSSTMHPATEQPLKPCPDSVNTEKPCRPSVHTVTEEYSNEEIEVIAEDEPEVKFPQVGSMRGEPGVNYPNYTDIPITSFTCTDKKYVPGFYADPETACQVFHVCYEHRRESFLCPVGTIFNQPILACDYWYSSDCSAACDYYDVNSKTELEEEKIDEEVEQLLTVISESEKSEEYGSIESVEKDLDKITQFFPVKAVVTEVEQESIPETPKAEEIASEIVDKMATTATKVISTTRDVVKSIPAPVRPILKPVEEVSLPYFVKPMKMKDLLKQSAIPMVKAKLATIPVSKFTALKTAVPFAAKTKVAMPVVAAKAKLATKVAAIPAIKVAAAAPVFAKAKLAATVPVAKAAVAVPAAKAALAKAKMAAAAVPAAKAAIAVPILAKAKMAAAVPVAKAAVAVPAAKAAIAVPVLAKAKMAAAVPIIAKGKVAVPAVKMAAAKVAVKSSIPALKAKMVASAVPIAKAKIVPLMKAKAISAGTPLLKAKMLALPLATSKLAGSLPIAKVKLAKAVAISPLTKKKLAAIYMKKLLKAKKLALMG